MRRVPLVDADGEIASWYAQVASRSERQNKWVWVKIKPPGIGPQVESSMFPFTTVPFWVPIFDTAK